MIRTVNTPHRFTLTYFPPIRNNIPLLIRLYLSSLIGDTILRISMSCTDHRFEVLQRFSFHLLSFWSIRHLLDLRHCVSVYEKFFRMPLGDAFIRVVYLHVQWSLTVVIAYQSALSCTLLLVTLPRVTLVAYRLLLIYPTRYSKRL